MNEGEARAEPGGAQPGTATGSAAAFGGPALRTMVQRGTAWSMAAYGGVQALRFLSNLILARLLFEEAFGLMALVNALLLGLQLFSDIGIGPSIIQNSRGDDPTFLNTAWTVQALRGLVLFVVGCAIAWPFAAFYHEPILAWILPVAALTALISGFNSTRLFSMYRRVDLSRIAVIELCSQGAAIVVMITWATFDRSLWPLVAGGIAGSLAKLVLSHTILPGISNRFHWDRSALTLMLRFGRWIFFSTVLTFLVGQSDRLIFGKMIPIAMLGIYSIGSMIATMPSAILGRVGGSVFFPVYSRVHNSGGSLRPVFGRVRRPLLILAGWMTAGLAGGGDAAVRLLYDQRYLQAGWIVQILALGSWFAVLESTNGAGLLAQGRANWIAAGSAGKLVGMVILIPIGYHLRDFPGAVLGFVCSDILKYVVSAGAAMRTGLRGWPQDLRLTAWVAATACMGWFLDGVAQRGGYSRFTVAAVVFLSVTLAWAPLGASLRPSRAARPWPD